MQKQDANRLADRLKGSCPKMTDQQVLDCAKKFDRFAPAVVSEAIDKYIEKGRTIRSPGS